jgi:hypothetical protein
MNKNNYNNNDSDYGDDNINCSEEEEDSEEIKGVEGGAGDESARELGILYLKNTPYE